MMHFSWAAKYALVMIILTVLHACYIPGLLLSACVTSFDHHDICDIGVISMPILPTRKLGNRKEPVTWAEPGVKHKSLIPEPINLSKLVKHWPSSPVES